jgi:hypothetical protein
MTTNTGGSAFPFAIAVGGDAGIVTSDEMGVYGLSIRDYFAAKATQYDIRDYMYEYDSTGNTYVIGMKQIRTREEAKYAYADAMLKARG